MRRKSLEFDEIEGDCSEVNRVIKKSLAKGKKTTGLFKMIIKDVDFL